MNTKRRKRIGIFGGKFDPIHFGHLRCAEWIREAANLDEVNFVIAASPPNKKNGCLDAEKRYEMAVNATAPNPYFKASRVELEHNASGYALLTVEAFARDNPGAELFWLSSSEYLDPNHQWYLPKWVGAKELFKLCTFLIFPRDQLGGVEQAQQWADTIKQGNLRSRIIVIDAPSPPLSSTMVRGLVSQGKSIQYTTPFVVQELIDRDRYYHQDGGPEYSLRPACPRQIKRIGIYGGRFDPIRYEHLIAAEWVAQEKELDKVLFVTSALPPSNKPVVAPAELRHQMVVAAIGGNPHLEASRMDLDRKTSSYALLNVESVQAKYGQDVEISILLSSEYLDPTHSSYLPTWMGAEALFKLSNFLIIVPEPSQEAKVEKWAKLLCKKCPDVRIEIMHVPTSEATSQMVRDRVSEGKSIWYMTPWPVQQLIAKYGLYGHQQAPKRSKRTKR